jgi:hypothetical protein
MVVNKLVTACDKPRLIHFNKKPRAWGQATGTLGGFRIRVS